MNMNQKNTERSQNKERENMKILTQDTELKARYWKAQVEVINYSMQYETLLPEYEKYLKRMQEKEAEARQRFMEQMQKNLDAGLVNEVEGETIPGENQETD